MQDFIKRECGRESWVVLDPVFLLGRKQWQTLQVKPKDIPSKYILVYSLEENASLNAIARAKANEMGIPLVSIHPLGSKNSTADINLKNVGPLEFLYAINNAEHFCTNSFHGVAFSLIFKKKFNLVKHSQLNSRIDNIINIFNPRSIENSKFNIEGTLEYDASEIDDKLFEDKISESIRFLYKSMLNKG